MHVCICTYLTAYVQLCSCGLAERSSQIINHTHEPHGMNEWMNWSNHDPRHNANKWYIISLAVNNPEKPAHMEWFLPYVSSSSSSSSSSISIQFNHRKDIYSQAVLQTIDCKWADVGYMSRNRRSLFRERTTALTFQVVIILETDEEVSQTLCFKRIVSPVQIVEQRESTFQLF